MKKLYFLGPKGTYSEVASNKAIKVLDFEVEKVEISTLAKIVNLLNSNPFDVGVLPIENSIEGIVRPTIDNLYLSDVKIQTQFDIPIEHCLISGGNDKSKLKHIISHPQALAQSQKYILENFDEKIDLINATSTAQAVYSLVDKDETYGAIASIEAIGNLNLNVLDKNIGDIKENKTRFVLVSKTKIELGKNTRTSIVFNTKNEPGALFNIMKIFEKYNLNLLYIESRPSKKVFGEYNFFVDIDKGLDEIKTAISEIKEKCNYYKLLGTYPCI